MANQVAVCRKDRESNDIELQDIVEDWKLKAWGFKVCVEISYIEYS